MLFVAVYLVPLVYAAYRSLFVVKQSGLGFGPSQTVFSGLSNYGQVLSSGAFWTGLERVLLYSVVQIPVMLGLAACLALLLDALAARGVRIFRMIYFLPYAVPGVVAALLWAYLYVPDLTPLHSVGISVDLLGTHILIFSIANIAVWSWTGYNTLIYISALQAVPRQIYEAARVDGATEWTLAWRVKFPMIRSALALTALVSIIGSIQLFSEPTVLSTVTTNVSSDYVPMMMSYNATFGQSDFDYGSAISIVIALIAGVLAVGYYQFTARRAR